MELDEESYRTLSAGLYSSMMCISCTNSHGIVEFYLYRTISTALIHLVKSESTRYWWASLHLYRRVTPNLNFMATIFFDVKDLENTIKYSNTHNDRLIESRMTY